MATALEWQGPSHRDQQWAPGDDWHYVVHVRSEGTRRARPRLHPAVRHMRVVVTTLGLLPSEGPVDDSTVPIATAATADLAARFVEWASVLPIGGASLSPRSQLDMKI